MLKRSYRDASRPRQRGRFTILSLVLAATMLVALGATRASASVTAAASPGHAAVTTASVPGPIMVSTAANTSADPWPLINYNKAPNGPEMCLGISGGGTDEPAVLWPCNGRPDQTWHWGVEYGTTGYQQLVNGDNMCLGVAGGDSTTEGKEVVGWTCKSADSDQYWYPKRVFCGSYQPYSNLKAVINGKNYVLGVAANSYNQGAAIVIWNFQSECNNQFWVP